MDNLVFKVYKSAIAKSDVVRLSGEAMQIIRQIQVATGLPASQVVSKMVIHCKDKIEIEEV